MLQQLLQHLKNYTVTITIGVSFFIFGFFVMADALHLTEREIVIGLISGGIGGITMLIALLVQERRANPSPVPVRVTSS